MALCSCGPFSFHTADRDVRTKSVAVNAADDADDRRPLASPKPPRSPLFASSDPSKQPRKRSLVFSI
jgi:hypothetical protein